MTILEGSKVLQNSPCPHWLQLLMLLISPARVPSAFLFQFPVNVIKYDLNKVKILHLKIVSIICSRQFINDHSIHTKACRILSVSSKPFFNSFEIGLPNNFCISVSSTRGSGASSSEIRPLSSSSLFYIKKRKKNTNNIF